MTRPPFQTRRIRLISETQRETAMAVLRNLPMCAERPLEVVFQRAKDSRSLRQNALFHKWMGIVALQYAEATGRFYPPAHWKEYFKALFLGEETIEVNGKVISRQRKTSELDVPDMSEFMEKVDHYCGSELGVFLPSPNTPDDR